MRPDSSETPPASLCSPRGASAPPALLRQSCGREQRRRERVQTPACGQRERLQLPACRPLPAPAARRRRVQARRLPRRRDDPLPVPPRARGAGGAALRRRSPAEGSRSDNEATMRASAGSCCLSHRPSSSWHARGDAPSAAFGCTNVADSAFLALCAPSSCRVCSCDAVALHDSHTLACVCHGADEATAGGPIWARSRLVSASLD